MKAIIMAGGEGTRLRPITCGMPKPAVPLCDKAIIIHIIQLLEKHGINDISITLKYLPAEIKKITESALAQGTIKSKIKYCTETIPLGTAGSVKNCIRVSSENSVEEEKEDYLVISGDAITDINLTEMIAFHNTKKPLVTIAVKAVEEPSEFGIVLIDKQSMITGFIEKPLCSEAVSNLANTGIYIVTPELMELCSDECPQDFAKDIFTSINDLSKNAAAYVTQCYWCDIGDINSYRNANLRYIENESQGYIGDNCNISKQATLINSVINHGCVIEAGSVIENSVILSGVTIGKHCKIKNSVICPNVIINDAVSADTVAIGEKSFIGAATILNPGAKIWSKTNILAESNIYGIIKPKPGGTAGAVSSYSTENIVRLGKAFGTFLGRSSSVVVCNDGQGSSEMIAAAMQAALAAVGISVKRLETVPLSVTRWICRSGVCDGAVYITENKDNTMHFLNGFGDDLSKDQRRKFKAIYDLEDFTGVTQKEIAKFETLSNPEDYYIASLLDIFKCPHKNLNYIGRKYSLSQRYAVNAYITIKMFKDAPVFIPAFDSLAAEKIANKYDRYIIKCGCKAGDIMAEMEKFMHIEGVYAQYLMLFDDLAFDLALCCIDGYINDEADTEAIDLIKEPVFRSEWRLPVNGSKSINTAEVIKKFTNSEFAKNGYEINDGICLHRPDFVARVCSEEENRAFHVYIESLSEEYGKEMAFDILKTLENLLT